MFPNVIIHSSNACFVFGAAALLVVSSFYCQAPSGMPRCSGFSKRGGFSCGGRGGRVSVDLVRLFIRMRLRQVFLAE